MRARILGLHAEDPALGVRRIAAKVIVETGVSVSRETVRKLLRSAEQEAERAHVVSYAADRAAVGVVGQGRGLTAWDRAMLTAMTAEDHAAMDAYTRAPAGDWFWSPRPSPDRWWVFP